MNKILNNKYKIIVFTVLFAIIFFTGLSTNFRLINPSIVEAVAKSEPLALNWLPYNEGLLKAEQENKHILVHFYTDGCSWCDKMEKEVFTNEEVKQIIQDKFIAIKIHGKSNNMVTENGEEITEQKLATLFQVTGYPTTWFLEKKGEKIAPMPGYAPAEQFVTVLKYIGEDWYKEKTFQEYVENKES